MFKTLKSRYGARAATSANLRGVVEEEKGSQIAEFAISAPLLAVFVVGIFDFSGALNLKQQIGNAAQAGALVAANQSTRDLSQPTSTTSPPSVVAIETSVFNNLANDKVLPKANVGSCKPASAIVAHPAAEPRPPYPTSALAWQYTISGCGLPGDDLVITIDRGDVRASFSDNMALSNVAVSYPHHWILGRIITLVVPTSVFLPITPISVVSVSHNMS